MFDPRFSYKPGLNYKPCPKIEGNTFNGACIGIRTYIIILSVCHHENKSSQVIGNYLSGMAARPWELLL